MQSENRLLRLSLRFLAAVLGLGAFGGMDLARDAFDGNFDDCPRRTRLSAVYDLEVERTDEEDEIRISWDSLEHSDLNELGANVFKSRITVYVEGGGVDDSWDVAVGDNSLDVDGVEFAKDLTVWVAVTLGDYVISDIAEAEFTSGMPVPVSRLPYWPIHLMPVIQMETAAIQI